MSKKANMTFFNWVLLFTIGIIVLIIVVVAILWPGKLSLLNIFDKIS